MKRGGRLPARNQERRPADVEAEVRAEVYARDRYRCVLDLPGMRMRLQLSTTQLPQCSGPLSPHHRRKASSGGAYTVENLVTACVGHNGWIEDEPDTARLLFPHLVVRERDPEYEQLGRRAARMAAPGYSDTPVQPQPQETPP